MSMSAPGPSPVNPPPWGTFSPSGYRRFLRSLVALGLARGSLKRWFYREWLRVGGNEPVDVTSHGLKLRLHPWDNTVESKLLLGSRSRDRAELEFLTAHLSPSGTFLDIGANIGFYSLVATARGAARTLAIEPLPSAFERLQFNIRANAFEDHITALQAALGGERGEVTLNMVEGDLGGSSIVKTGLVGRPIQVLMLPLADALAQNGFTQVSAMKIDVEGMEDSVLCPFFKSAPASLWPRRVIMEDVHHRDWKEDVLALMLKAGYEQTGRSRSNVFLRFRAVG